MPRQPDKPNLPRRDNRGPRPQYGPLHRHLAKLAKAENPVCVRCWSRYSEDAHHLRYPARSLEDYLPLCEKCHIEWHKEHDT